MNNKKIVFLKMVVKNHPLLKENLEFSLVADQRVMTEDADDLTNLYGRVWINNITTIVGRNATGKTTTMQFLLGILELLLQNKSINQTRLGRVLYGDEPITVETYFYGSNNALFLDEVIFEKREDNWLIGQETIYTKKALTSTAKKEIFNFDGAHVWEDREQLDDKLKSVLAPDDSIFRMLLAREKYQAQGIFDTLLFTNVNALIYNGAHVPQEILAFLDPSVEYLEIGQSDAGQSFYRLKFKNNSKEITDSNFATIEYYLSSGTAKAITMYQQVLRALQTGGIVFIDELENHFNQAIVRSFIQYFTDPTINKKRAVLIFSTHYSMLLDDLNRGDQIYVARRNGNIDLTRYSDFDVRQDIQKSEVFDADILKGTSPDYKAFMALIKATKEVINGE